MFEFKKNEFIAYPIISISKNSSGLVITTKKIGSRFFEDISLKINQEYDETPTAIDFRVDKFIQDKNTNEIDSKIVFNDKIISVAPSPVILNSIDKFFNISNISSISELFSADYLKTNEVFFITRNPIHRFYTGYFEKVDSIVGLGNDRLVDKPQSIIDSVLNEYTLKIDYSIFSDEHLSLWNTFLLKVITDNNLKNYVNIIDLDDYDKMKIFEKCDQPSNKTWITNWLNNVDNKLYINQLESKFKFYFDLELHSYNTILNK